MRTHGTIKRAAAVAVATGALLLLPAAGAQAAASDKPSAPASAAGTQGWQLCLLSQCSTGSDQDGDSGPVQGMNLCILAFCSVGG